MAVGCANHHAQVLDRTGAVVCEADSLTQVDWGRMLSDTASARAFIVPQGDCCQRAANIRTMRHRLVIWRGGRPVFDGPIQTVEWSADGVSLTAYDWSSLLDRRLPHSDMDFINTDLCDIAAAMVSDALLPDDPGLSVEVVASSNVYGDRSYRIDVGRSLDHLRDLADTGMDWTVAGSRILLMGDSFCYSIGSLSDNDFPQGLRVVEDGGALVSRWVMWAGPQGTIKASSGGLHDYYGLLESVHDALAPQDLGAASVLDQTSADAAVASLLASSLPAPVFIDTGAGPLAPTAPVEVSSLVPGYCLQISSVATCREVTAVQKIFEVRVSETSQGESVQVICAPAVSL